MAEGMLGPRVPAREGAVDLGYHQATVAVDVEDGASTAWHQRPIQQGSGVFTLPSWKPDRLSRLVARFHAMSLAPSEVIAGSLVKACGKVFTLRIWPQRDEVCFSVCVWGGDFCGGGYEHLPKVLRAVCLSSVPGKFLATTLCWTASSCVASRGAIDSFSYCDTRAEGVHGVTISSALCQRH